MIVKKKLWLISICALFVCLSGCDAGLKITGIEITDYPSNIVYYAGIDKSLNLDGGTVALILKSDASSVYDMNNEHQIKVTNNIDFETPGVYVVTLSRGEFSCEFPVQVLEGP